MQIKGKVLFIYPNAEGYGGIPNGLALLSGCLKNAGFETKCFDTTFLNSSPKTLFNRNKHGGVEKSFHEKFWGKWKEEYKSRIPSLLREEIKTFKPDLIAISIVDVCFNFSMQLLSYIEEDIPVVAGGSTATLDPDLVISNENVDIVCIGEGEYPLVELAERIVENKDYSDIKNLWVKKDGKVVKNSLRKFIDLDTIAFQDWDMFDKKQYYKPYQGDFLRTGFFEMSRGCQYNCTFCCTSKLREVYRELGKYVRTRSVDKALDEVEELSKKYKLELIFFSDDNFFGVKEERLKYFCEQYKKRIGLPFYISTRPESINDKYIKEVKKAGISSIGIGVEHGDEEYRKKFLNRKMKNEIIEKAFKIVHDNGIRSTANIIIGMPGEKENMICETIKLMKKIKPKSYSINYFAPYRGTKLREQAIRERIISKNHLINDSNICLDLPYFSKERIIHYYENFGKYLSGELNV